MKDNLIRQLVLKYINKSKLFYGIMALTIVVTTMLITCIFLFSESLITSYDNISKGKVGNFKLMISEITNDQADSISKTQGVTKFSLLPVLPQVRVNEEKLKLYSIDKTYMDENYVKIIKGKYPESNNDIAIEEEYSIKRNLKLNDKITLDSGEIFNIIGITSDFQYGDRTEGFRGYLKYDKYLYGETYDLYIECDKVSIKSIIDNVTTEKIINDKQIQYGDNSNDSQKGNSSGAIIALIIVLLILATFFSINNLYSINLKKRLSNIGLLITVGATDRQISKMFNFEVLIFSTIPIIVGILLGNLSTYWIIKVGLLSNTMVFNTSFKTNFIVYCIVFGTVMISIKSLIVKIKKTSPVEAVKVLDKESKFIISKIGFKISDSLFKDLAKANIRRNSKSIVINITSVIIGGILIIVSNTAVLSFDYKKFATAEINSDVKVYPRDVDVSLDRIKQIDGIQSIEWYKRGLVADGQNIPFNMFITNDVGINRIAKDNNMNINSEDIGGNNVLIMNSDSSDDSFKEYEIGDELDLNVAVKKDISGGIIFESTGEEFKGRISKILNKISVNFYNRNLGGYLYTIIIHEDSPLLEDIKSINKYDVLEIFTKDGKAESVKNEFLDIYGKNASLTAVTLDDLFKETHGIYKQMFFMINSISILIQITVLFNFIISLSTMLLSRKQEFGMLRAIGLTDDELKKMVNMEFVIVNIIIVSMILVIGNALGYLSVYGEAKTNSHIIYKLPLMVNIIIISIILLSQRILSKTIIEKINKEAIIEQIKNTDY